MAKYKGKSSRMNISNTGDSKKETPVDFKPKKINYKKSNIFDHFSTIFDFIADIARWIADFFLNLIPLIREHKIITAGLLTGFIIGFSVILASDFKNVNALATFKPNITTKIYDKNGILISELFEQKREVVPFNNFPKQLINAFISMEDNEFYEHIGINIKGIVRAFFINIFAGRIRQGGSTITQQTAKILLTSRKRNIYRKIKEAFISLMMEMKYSKNEILSLYLNQIYLGQGAYGVESASKLYFKKSVRDLNLAESALLSTLPSSPNRLSPIRHPKRSMIKHKIALAKMVELGFITVPEAEKAYLEFWPDFLLKLGDISPTQNTWSSRINRAPWFTEYIRRKLIKKYGKETVYKKGLLVYTTLDLKKQEAGQKVLKPALERQTAISSNLLFKNDDLFMDNYYDTITLVSDLFDIQPFRKKGSRENDKINKYIRKNLIEEIEVLNYFSGIDHVSYLIDEYKKTYFNDKSLQKVEGCIISINPGTGYIEVMIGGGEFSSINQLNRTMQSRRQPGSAIKPLLYASAFATGKFSPATAILDSPIVYLDSEGGDWLPENYSGQYFGMVRLRRALAKSINVISIKIADALGIDYVRNYYAKMLKFSKKEMNKRIPRNFSIALGSFDVSPFELTRAYAIIANGGKDVIPFSIRYIKDRNGKIIENREEEVKTILREKRKKGNLYIMKPSTAQSTLSVLRTVITSGTGAGAHPGRPSAGKTGTTNNWKDAWFVGFVPQLATGIWLGYDKLGLSLGNGQAGGNITAPLWRSYMKLALKHEPVRGFPVFAALTEKEVCAVSGLLPSSFCKNIIKEKFVTKAIPEKTCDICEGRVNADMVAEKGPNRNISKSQKASILKTLNNSKENGKDTDLEPEDDLLD